MKRIGWAATGKYRDRIAIWCFQHASTGGDVSLVLYDVTTPYFEAEKEGDLRKVGFSRERRVDPQIVVGQVVKAETATIVTLIRQLQVRHGLADMLVVADAGMFSAGTTCASWTRRTCDSSSAPG